MEQRLIDANALHYHVGVNQNDKQIFYVTGEDIDAAPTIDPESLRPHGCWIRTETALWQVQYKCSCCGCKWPGYARFFAYCPYCGAKMENTDES